MKRIISFVLLIQSSLIGFSQQNIELTRKIDSLTELKQTYEKKLQNLSEQLNFLELQQSNFTRNNVKDRQFFAIIKVENAFTFDKAYDVASGLLDRLQKGDSVELNGYEEGFFEGFYKISYPAPLYNRSGFISESYLCIEDKEGVKIYMKQKELAEKKKSNSASAVAQQQRIKNEKEAEAHRK